ncbi:META domain-containing protein [Pseudazoarcus pumilus]|nr:META domain-containing protein [Pseudazoarcus pumilus]
MNRIHHATLIALLALSIAPAMAQATPVGSYVGILPCADCPAIELRLDLLEDGAFHQRSVYRDRSGSFDAIGRWKEDDARLRLHYPNADTVHFAIDEDSLKLLDRQGQPIDSRQEHRLYRSARLGLIEPRVRLEGHFRYYADSATLHDCATDRRLPVAMEGDYLRLERAWSHARATMQRPLPAVVQARIVHRVNMEGPPRPTVIVERLISAGTAVSCTPQGVATLYDTPWTALRIGDRDVPVDARPAQLRFTEGLPTRISGSTGCNRFNGTATLTGGSLLVGTVTTTKMACPDNGLRERAFLDALDAARSWRIRERQLELLDAQGRTVAVFDADQRGTRQGASGLRHNERTRNTTR